MNQLDFFAPIEPVEPSANRGTITERFAAFHAQNPHVAKMLAALARQLIAAGHEHIGIKMLWERLRFEYALRTTGDEFKLNNSYTALYARLLMREYPDLAGAFELRERRAA